MKDKEEKIDKYTDGYLARCALLKAINKYDAAQLPGTEEIRGNMINAALYLAPFKQPPEAYKDAPVMEGPEDWFGVL